MRINKCLSNFSRREVDRRIREGRIKVNFNLAKLGQEIKSGDEITIDNQRIDWETFVMEKKKSPTYWKPLGVTCTTTSKDPSNILDKGQFRSFSQRIFPVGRIDKNSTGLILLTSDSRLLQAFLQPTIQCKKVYQVQFTSSISDEQIDKLQQGVLIPSEIKRNSQITNSFESFTLPCEVKRSSLHPHNSNHSVEISLTEGRNRQIRLMAESVGLKVQSLHRIEFGGIRIEGLKSSGDWKSLNHQEMQIVQETLERSTSSVQRQLEGRVSFERECTL